MSNSNSDPSSISAFTTDPAKFWANGTEAGKAAMAQFQKMFGEMKMPAMPDMEALIVANRRNMEVLSAANRVALEGAQTVARRHMEIMQQTMADMTTTMKMLANGDSATDKAARQAGLLKDSYQRAVANIKEISDLIQRCNGEAVSMLNNRVTEAMDEWKTLIEKSAPKA
jgi:phasin family protein